MKSIYFLLWICVIGFVSWIAGRIAAGKTKWYHDIIILVSLIFFWVWVAFKVKIFPL